MHDIGWTGTLRLGLVQAAIGAMVMISTSLLNRIMMVEYGLAAAVPAGLVAWHYAVQLSRPLWGHGSDRGRRRSPWIIGGMGVLGLGTLLAVDALPLIATSPVRGMALAILAYALIGAGVGAAGTSMLALLAAHTPPPRRAAAAATVWIMMIAGIAISAGVVGGLIDPFSVERLAMVVGGAVLVAFLLVLLVLAGLEREGAAAPAEAGGDFPAALRSVWADAAARRFTLFIFVSMLAYSMQDLILEPFGGLVFRLSPGATTRLSGVHHGGILAGMILAGAGGMLLAGRRAADPERWIVAGCLVSALALCGLTLGAAHAEQWPLGGNLIALGLGNGLFTAAALGAMMRLAGAAGGTRSGMRMGVWGAAQAIAFGLGGLSGAVLVDVLRHWLGIEGLAFQIAFAVEASLFLLSALIAASLGRGPARAPVAVAA
jgi:BCD family chlorophyll transporter-like MFS transporter